MHGGALCKLTLGISSANIQFQVCECMRSPNIHTCVFVHVFVYSCVRMYKCVCVCVCVCGEVTGRVFVDVRGGRAFDGAFVCMIYIQGTRNSPATHFQKF